MFRVLGAAFVLALAAPTTALACGMYIPPTKHEATLADVLDSIDEVAKPEDAKPAALVNANTEPEAATTADATLPSEDETRHGKRHKPNS